MKAAAPRLKARKYFSVAVLLGGLLAANSMVLTQDVDVSPIASHDVNRREGPAQPAPLEITAAVLDETDRKYILGRPLFHADRRPHKQTVETAPPEQVAAPIAPPIPLPPGTKLVGILQDVNGRKALMRSARTPLAQWLGQGDTFEGWNISSVDAASVTLEAGGRKQVISLLQPFAEGLNGAPRAELGGGEITNGTAQ